MVILHNVVGMTSVIKDMQQEGAEITPDMLGGLAPLRPGHINRFGDYTLDFKRKLQSIDFNLPIKPMQSTAYITFCREFLNPGRPSTRHA